MAGRLFEITSNGGVRAVDERTGTVDWDELSLHRGLPRCSTWT